MCILPDHEIERRLKDGELGIEPFTAKHVTPNGYDLTIKEILVRGQEKPQSAGDVVVPAGGGFLVSTREFVTMPKDVTGQLWIRSSYARKGVLASFGKVEAAFAGELTLAAFNSAPTPLTIPIGDRFAQIVFEKMEAAPHVEYAKRSGNYQGQRGVTLARDTQAR
jgi:dCTP deaminase